jgi:hypothetical protein
MKTSEEVQPTFSYTPGNTGDVMLAKGPKGGFIRDANINYDIDTDILGITGQVRTERLLFDNSGVRVGNDSGVINQGFFSIAIGPNAGYDSQGSQTVAIGDFAGYDNQGSSSVAIGPNAGFTGQDSNSVAIGGFAGYDNQGFQSVALGSVAGSENQGSYSVAIGGFAGYDNQGSNSVAIGPSAGKTDQGSQSVAIGDSAGFTDQGSQSVAIGPNAGFTDQGSQSVALGYNAGYGIQGAGSVAIGSSAGFTGQGSQSVAIGPNAGFTGQGSSSVALGFNAGYGIQGSQSVAIGPSAGFTGQGSSSVALGFNAGYGIQGAGSVAIGPSAGFTGQGSQSVALGFNAGYGIQGSQSVAIGPSAGKTDQGSQSVAIGGSAGFTGQGSSSVAIGSSAGKTDQGSNSVALGDSAGFTGQGSSSVAIGYSAGKTDQDIYSVAIGDFAGFENQGTYSVALGSGAGSENQGSQSVAIGGFAGFTGQGNYSVALGYSAGKTDQGSSSVAIGDFAGLTDQGSSSVAIGDFAGSIDQGSNSVAIGYNAGKTDQGFYSVAIGDHAGFTGQGSNSVALGYNAGYSNQAENTIILNATGDVLNSVGDASACYIKPIRNVDTSYNLYEPLAYNKTTGELVSGNNVGFKMITDSFSVTGGSASGKDDKLFAYSYDGITWEQDEMGSGTVARTFTDGSCNALGYDGTLWVAGGVGESAIVHSANGITWERNNDNARFVLDSGSWRTAVDISCDLVGSGERFASSLGLDQSGNVMAVGAYGYNSNEGNVSLYDYSMNSDSWVKTYDLSSNVAGESFGYSLAMTKIDATTTRIAIGAPTNDTADGQVYVYDTSYNENTWGQRTIRLVGAAIVNVGGNEKIGSAIAINDVGTRLLIGAPENTSGQGAVYNFDLSNNVWTRNPINNIFDGTSGNFGYSITMNSAGNRCLISAPNLSTGRVYSYDVSDNSGYWGLTSSTASFTPDQDLSYNSNVVDASFGHAITMNDAGDWCAVGAPNAGSGRGWVGIYNYNYRAWGLYTDISGQTAGDKFGSSVAMNGAGDRLIVGAKGYASGVGRNYVYNYNSETLIWEFERTVSFNSSNQGETLAIDTLGNRFVSGAPSHATNNGTLAVYDRQMKCNALTANGGNWIGGGNAVRVNQDTPFAYSADGITNWQAAARGKEQAILRKELFYATASTNNNFGARCAMNAAGTRLVVGSPGATVGGVATKGRVCIYDYDLSLNDWISEPTKVYEGVATGDRMGADVALNAAGDILVFSIVSFDTPLTNSGRVDIYHYNYITGQWPNSPTRYYVGDNVAGYDYFGTSVVINARGDRIAVGYVLADHGAVQNPGTVYIVDYNHTTGQWPGSDGTSAISIPGRIQVNCTNSYATMGSSLSFNAAGDILAIGAPSAVAASNINGAVHIIERDNTTGKWGRLDKLSQMGVSINVSNTGNNTSYAFNNNNINFGWKVSLNAKGDRLAVSQYTYGSTKGRVYIIDYDYNTKSWPGSGVNIETTPFKFTRYYDGLTTSNYWLGYSLTFNAAGDRLLIGAIGDDTIVGDSGIFYVIDYNAETGGWPGNDDISSATYIFYPTAGKFFGGSCAINALGNRIAIGANRFGVSNDLFSADSSDKYGTDNGYVRLYDLLSLPIQLNDCRALTTFNGQVIAGGKGSGKHRFAISSDNGVSWTNNQVNDEALFNARYDWSGNPLTFPTNQVSKYTEQFFGVGGGTQDAFGDGCAINYDGTRCVIGAVQRNTDKGALYFFHNDDGNGWTLNTQYDNTNTTGGFLGHVGSISINDAGTRVVAGAHNNDINGTNSGSLYIFDYINGEWVETIRIDGNVAEYSLGRSCAMNAKGDRFIVGERRFGVATLGFAYIYHFSNNIWSLAKTYTNGTTTTINTTGKFGLSCAMNGAGDRVVVGCPVDEIVYIYDYMNGNWNTTISTSLTNNTTTGGYGISCSLNTAGDRLIVGDASGNVSPGSVYIYHRNNVTGVWSSVAERTYTGETAGDQFGLHVALDGSGDRVIIGAPEIGTSKGGAYIYSYDYTNNRWPLTTTNYDISFAGLSNNDVFGTSVAFTRLGHKALIGADMYTAANYGRAYLYNAARSSSDIFCNALAVKGSNELLVAGLGGTGVSNPLAWSADGITWNLSDNGAAIFTGSGVVCKAVAWNGSRWVAGGKSTGGPLAYSYNGKKWYNSMNGATLLGATSTCNAVSWNGKYWMASVEGATGGQTQVYSNDGMAWLASNNGDELFSGTSQALALATVKMGEAGGGGVMETLQSQVNTLQLTQFGVGQRWSANLADSRPANVTFYNNTNKLMFVNLTGTLGTGGYGLWVYVNAIGSGNRLVAANYSPTISHRLVVTFVVPIGASYYWTNWVNTSLPVIDYWQEFYES